MMMWQRKKSFSPSPSSSQSSSSSSIFHLSWLSKIKKSRKNFECKPEKGEKETPMSCKMGKFYGGDDGSDWRLSFKEENYEVAKSRTGLKSVWYDSEDENQERAQALKFNQMVSNIRKLRKLPYYEDEKARENREFKGSKKEQKLRKRNVADSEENNFLEKELNLRQQEKAFSSKSIFETIEEDSMLEALSLDEKSVNSKEVKLRDLVSKGENQRKSVYISTKHNSKVRAYSPRAAYKMECKIKAIENMKRAKKKTEKRLREKSTAFDSYAVVKSSFDPQSDFKKSMIEMITVKGITKAAELEELLACYLTLNADVYHETIIKVFRQVWFELIQDHLAPEI